MIMPITIGIAVILSVFTGKKIVCCQFYWGPHPDIIRKSREDNEKLPVEK